MSDVERAAQQHYDSIARVNQETWECESCAEEFDSDGMCEHDGNIHTYCQECCDASMEDEYKEQFGKEDLD